MNREHHHRLAEIVDRLQERGLYHFSRTEIEPGFSGSANALSLALHRLQQKNRIARIRNDFYIILPLEHRIRGMIPVDWFLDALMKSLGEPYYVGLLSAAALYGAAHQQIQETQVVVTRQLRPLRHPKLTIRFFAKQDLQQTPLRSIRGYAGDFPAATPEATALDLIRYSPRIGGLDAVTTVLHELAESMSPPELAQVVARATPAHARRLGFVLDFLGQSQLADAVFEALGPKATGAAVALDSTLPRQGVMATNRWDVIENTGLEPDL